MSRIMSTDCIAKDFDSEWYKKWAEIISLPASKHPKSWEMAVIAEMLESHGYLKPGRRGLGMGVGTEQLTSVFAKYDVKVTATDQDPNLEKSDKWDNGQLAHGKKSLFYAHILPESKFNTNVKYQIHDMNTYNSKYVNKFDFIWHNCVIGHLGSLEKSKEHLIRSAKYLKDGGGLVFTTELNISSLTESVTENSDTVVWRLSDLEELFKEMASVGMIAERFKLRLGDTDHDTRVNYNHLRHVDEQSGFLLSDRDYSEIKIPFSKFAVTQIVLFFKKGPISNLQKLNSQYEKDNRTNTVILKKHIEINDDLRDYYTTHEDIEYYDADLIPERKEIEITMEAGSVGKIDLRFFNNSCIRLFDFSHNIPYGRPPLVLGTFNPVNRNSNFATDDWASPNRPAVIFAIQKVESSPDWNEHRANPGECFEYCFHVKAPKKCRIYHESLVLIFEGKAVVLSSQVDITIRVVPRKLKSRKSAPVDFKYFARKKKLDKLINKEVLEDFDAWLKILAKRDFRNRSRINIVELTQFLLNFQKYKGYDLGETELTTLFSKDISTEIIINPPSLVPGLKSKIIFQMSSPRVGGTLFNEIVASLTGWTALQGGVSLEFFDLNSISSSLILHMHIPEDQFHNEKINIPFQVVTVARNPLDSLVSSFMFAQKNISRNWPGSMQYLPKLNGEELEPSDSQFYKWAMSEDAKSNIHVSESWWNKADARVKYEDYRANPARAIEDVLKIIDPARGYSNEEIIRTVEHLDKTFLVNTTNRHRWNGGSGYSEKMIPPKWLDEIKNFHKEAIKTLGY